MESNGRELLEWEEGMLGGRRGPNRGGRLARRGLIGDKSRIGSSSTHTRTHVGLLQYSSQSN
jgi:hypothetical protein